MSYRGRFAPSPSGPLHFGSLIAAIASYLQAKSQDGKWIVRIEDIDVPRTVSGADKSILETLEKLNLHWDEEVLYQSQRQERYDEIIEQLKEKNYLYTCSCSRKEIAEVTHTCECRNSIYKQKESLSTRIKVDNHSISFKDKVQGEISQQENNDADDFIIKRADSITAYNLAVVIDDADQEITEVVRGCDLIDTTVRQIFLQQIIGFPTPAYLHFPVAVDEKGNKLSKQNHAPEIDLNNSNKLFIAALDFLGQKPISEIHDASNKEIMAWAQTNWSTENIPGRHNINYIL